MIAEQAINYLENLEKGNFLTVNIPIFRDETAQVTAMYLGKDKDGNYNFLDTGNFKLTKEFLEKGKITIDKEYDGDTAMDIHKNSKLSKIEKDKRIIEIIDKFTNNINNFILGGKNE